MAWDGSSLLIGAGFVVLMLLMHGRGGCHGGHGAHRHRDASNHGGGEAGTSGGACCHGSRAGPNEARGGAGHPGRGGEPPVTG